MLDKAGLQNAIISALDAAESAGQSGNYTAWRDTLAQDLSTAIDDFVKTGQVDTTVTIPATSAPGTPSSGTGTGGIT